jgi:type IV secretion system protein VirB10
MSNNDTDRPIVDQLRLRTERAPVTRLSRKVLAGLAGVGGIAVIGALFYALETRRSDTVPQELYNTGNKPIADGLANLPKDYTGIPKLGPPLPGDLGRPILHAEEQGKSVPLPVMAPITPDPALQRLAQETEAARTSRLFTQVSNIARAETQVPAAPNPAGGPQVPGGPGLDGAGQQQQTLDPNALQNMQDRKTAFLNAPVDRRTVSEDRLASPPSPYVVQAGTVIPAALITGLRSDLPGQVTAQVTENVYDTPTGQFLLLPQGSRLIGTYDAGVAFGQSRVLLVWTRVILPNGKSIVLERQPGADPEGYAGLQDQVDYHWGNILQAALVSTLLGVGANVGQSSNENDIVQALRQSTSQTANQAGQQFVQRQMNVQPTLTIRPGFPVRVIVTKDLVLAPFAG